MKKILSVVLLFLVLAIIFAFTGLLNVKAEGEFTKDYSQYDVSVTIGSKTITGLYTNPETYYEDSASGYLVSQEVRFNEVSAQDKIIYTPEYNLTTTNRAQDVIEYVCEENNAHYYITSINSSKDGSTYIPIGGFVLSLPSSYVDTFNVGDEVVLNTKINIPKKAVESSSGKRIVVDNTNTTRSAPMVVYYDYQFGEKTGTNIYGTEMTCTYDFEQNTFKVISFRGFGTGDDSGSVIPDNSFVLSAYGEGYRGLLVKGELFSVGDEVKMVGFDFIRFGGRVTGTYNFINPTPEMNPKGMETETSPFPAYRGENQTIIYKYGWSYNGEAGTGTNVYGYEAAVDSNGVVVELNVNVSTIPENGYVISGHGKGRDFVRSNIVLGATIELNEESKTYTISTTLNSYYENLVTSVQSSIANAQTKKRQLYDLDYTLIDGYISELNEKTEALRSVKEEIEAGLDGGNWTEKERLSHLMIYNSYQIEIEKINHKLISASVESKAVAAKSVWHRPIESSYQEIDNNLKLYSEIGINLVFVETLYGGYSTFKTKYNDLFPYNPKLSTTYSDGTTEYNDYLSCFVAVAKKYNIEVHAWVENFYVGTQNIVPIVSNHPDWILYNDDDTYIQRNEGGLYIFIDPANEEVQDLLINYYLDLFEKVPDCKGLNLDYIRYPVSDDAEDTGYTMTAMEGFYTLKGLTFSEAQKSDRTKMARKFKQLFDVNYLVGGEKERKENYDAWVKYRTSIITSYVRRIKEEVKDVKHIQLSTAVFASIIDSLDFKKQDWKTWISNGWIDIATPMAYYTDSSDVLKNVSFMVQSAGDNSFYYAGLASSYSGLPAYRGSEQIDASYKGGASGYVIFCSTQIVGHEDVQEALKLGPNRTQAVLPHGKVEDVLDAMFSSILSRCESIYIPNGGVSAEQLQKLTAKFNEIKAMPNTTAEDIYNIQKAVDEIYSLGISTYAKGYSGQRITESLKELSSILDTHISRVLIDSNEWDPEKDPVRPSFEEDEPDVPPKDDDKGNENPSGNNEPETPTKKGCKSSLESSIGILIFISMIILIITIKKQIYIRRKR